MPGIHIVVQAWCGRHASHGGSVGIPAAIFVSLAEQKHLVDGRPIQQQVVLVDAAVDKSDRHTRSGCNALSLDQFNVSIGAVRMDGRQPPLVFEVPLFTVAHCMKVHLVLILIRLKTTHVRPSVWWVGYRMATSVVAAAVAAVRVAARRSPGPDFPVFQKVVLRPVAVEQLAPLPAHFLPRLLRHRRQKGSRPRESVRQRRSSQAIETGLDPSIACKACVKPKCSAVAMQTDFQKVPMWLCCSIPGQAGNRCLYMVQSMSGHFLSRK